MCEYSRISTCNIKVRVCVLGVPAELPAQGPAGRGEGLVQGGATVGGSANPDGSQAQTEGGQTPGEWSLDAVCAHEQLPVHLHD